METNKLNNQDANEVEGSQVTDKGLEMNPSGNLENSTDNTLENEYAAISDIEEKAEKALADLKQTQKEIEEIEYSTKSVTDSINQIKEQELGLPKETGEIPSLRNMIKRGQELVKEKAKLIAFLTATGFLTLANTGEATAQTNKPVDKNPEKMGINDLDEVRQKNMDKWISKNYDLVKSGKLAVGAVKRGPDGNDYIIGAELDKDLFKLNNSEESIDGPDNNTKKLNMSSFFKTGTVEYIDKNSEEKAMQSIRDFLDSVQDLDNSTIKVLGTYSVDRKFGEVSPDHPDGDKNTQIAKEREKVGLDLVKKVLKERYTDSELTNLSLKSEAKGVSVSEQYTEEEISKMNNQDFEKATDLNQGFSIEIIKKIINKAEKIELSPEEKEYLNAALVILDKSKSMENDSKRASSIIEKINKNSDSKIQTLTLEGGNNEAHLQTLEKALFSLDENSAGKDVIVITDEPDNTLDGDSYNQKIDQILKLAKEKKVNILLKLFNPKMGPNPSKVSFITLKLDDYNKNALKSVASIPNVKYQTKEDKWQYWFNTQAQDSSVAVSE